MNGCDSMSPMVPPISVMTTSASFVRDVRNDLHRRAEVFPAPLLVEHVPVHLAGGEVGILVQVFVNEPLIVAEVKVGFRAVLGHVHLAVLIRAHGAGVDVDVGVELLRGHLQPARLEQPPEGGRRDALAEPGHNAARYKDILRHRHFLTFRFRRSWPAPAPTGRSRCSPPTPCLASRNPRSCPTGRDSIFQRFHDTKAIPW